MFGCFVEISRFPGERKGYWHMQHFSDCPLGGSVVQHFTWGFNRVALASVMLPLPLSPNTQPPFSATSQILEKLIIEMHCKIYDWISHRPNIIVVLSRVSLFPASTTLPEVTIQGSSRVPAIIQCSVCSPNEPFGKSRGQELLETSTFSLSLRAFLTSSLHPFLPLTHTHTHSPTHM